VASILQDRSSLALGNIVGSCISNILGAFSLGLLFHPGRMTFDRSARIYSALLFLVTTMFTIVGLTKSLGWAAGCIFIGAFAIYLASVAYAIYKGVLDRPEDSESDDSDDSDDSGGDVSGDSYDTEAGHQHPPTDISPLLPNNTTGQRDTRQKHSLIHHTAQLILGFVALSLSGYILSHSTASIADAVGVSDTVLGVTVLSFATTLPEKFVSGISGARGHGGIVIAGTVGSNIFLLTLCLGTTLVAGNLKDLEESVIPFELLVTWVSSALLLPTVFFSAGRWVGGMFLVLYLAFTVLEFTIYRR
jgi:Ca2+/Na+ antiporter